MPFLFFQILLHAHFLQAHGIEHFLGPIAYPTPSGEQDLDVGKVDLLEFRDQCLLVLERFCLWQVELVLQLMLVATQ